MQSIGIVFLMDTALGQRSDTIENRKADFLMGQTDKDLFFLGEAEAQSSFLF